MGIANPYYGGNFDSDDWDRCSTCGNIVCTCSRDEKTEYKQENNMGYSNFNGYDDAKWGDSVEDIKKLYQDIDDVTEDTDRTKGILVLQRKRDIMTQLFHFYNDKLYGVKLRFLNIDNTSKDLLLEMLVEKYGRFDSTYDYKELIPDDDEVYMDNTVGYRNVSPTMSIRLINRYVINKFTEGSIYDVLFIDYFNKTVTDQIKLDNAKEKIRGIIL